MPLCHFHWGRVWWLGVCVCLGGGWEAWKTTCKVLIMFINKLTIRVAEAKWYNIWTTCLYWPQYITLTFVIISSPLISRLLSYLVDEIGCSCVSCTLFKNICDLPIITIFCIILFKEIKFTEREFEVSGEFHYNFQTVQGNTFLRENKTKHIYKQTKR